MIPEGSSQIREISESVLSAVSAESAQPLFMRVTVSRSAFSGSAALRPSIISERDSFKYVEKGKTYLEGEYRVKDEIDLSYVVGLNLPVGFILDSMFGYKYFFCSGEEMRRM
jgi:YHS domain-containing protein